jgi:hypothetical protein
MPTERLDLGVELRIEPVSLDYCRLQVVRHQGPGYPAKLVEGILQCPDEVFGALAGDGLAVTLARMTEDHPQHVRHAAPAVGTDQRRPTPEVNLGFLARGAFHPAERQRRGLAELANEAPHAVILRAKGVLGRQILVNPRGRQALFQLGQNHGPEGFAAALGCRLVFYPVAGVLHRPRRGGLAGDCPGRRLASD